MAQVLIITGDVRTTPLRSGIAKLVYSDPPRNVGMNQARACDTLSEPDYNNLIYESLLEASRLMQPDSYLVISTYYKNRWIHESMIHNHLPELEYVQELIWDYNFGLYTRRRFVPCHDNLLVYRKGKPKFYWQAIAVPSQRLLSGDIRADSRGRTPGSIIKVPRTPGNSLERLYLKGDDRTCQPADLMNILLHAYTLPGEMVVELFAGSAPMAKVCHAFGRSCIAVDISEPYCHEAYMRVTDWKRVFLGARSYVP